MPGLPALRQTIAEVILDSYQRQTDPDTEITITAGATEGLFSSISALVRPGDEVILFDPSYDSYDPAVRLNGGIPIHINLKPPHFKMDWEEVISSITSKTRLLIINTPHNPTGSVLEKEDINILEDLVNRYPIMVLSDEVYERIIFDGKKHLSVLSSPTLASQSIAVFSFGKTFHATGWKMGYTVAPPALTKEIRKTHQFITFSVNTPIQGAISHYLKNKEHYLSLGSFFQKKRDLFLKEMEGSKFEPIPSFGSYFQLMSFRNISTQPDAWVAEEITKKYKVASIPTSVFYQDRSDHSILRFCFAKKEETLIRAASILKGIQKV